MILCLFATIAPLLLGLARGQAGAAIFGALTGYLLAINDHLGPLKKRWLIVTFTFAFLITGIALGLLLSAHALEYQLCLFTLVYFVGLFGGEGAELESATIFLVLAMILAGHAHSVPRGLVPVIFPYCLLSYLLMMAGIPALMLLRKRPSNTFVKFSEPLRKLANANGEAHIHAASFTLMAFMSIWLAQTFHFSRGYWITVTTLLVMRPDRTRSLYKTIQRLFGTALGVLLCELIIVTAYNPGILLLSIAICALAVPFTLLRNYILASFFITIFVLLLLELATARDLYTPFVRLEATAIGCGLSVMGALLSGLVCIIFRRIRAPIAE